MHVLNSILNFAENYMRFKWKEESINMKSSFPGE